MYCTNCGMKFEGKFCPVCGKAAQAVNSDYIAAQKRASIPNAEPFSSAVPASKPASKRNSSLPVIFGMIGVLALFFLLIVPSVKEQQEYNKYYEATYNTEPTPTPIPPKSHPFPPNDTFKYHYDNSYVDFSDPLKAPFSIKVPNSYKYWIVRLCNIGGTQKVMTIYIHGGKTAEVDIPLGDYSVYYACGNAWYGDKNLFLADGAYYKCDSVFDFYDDGEYLCGHELELQTVANGNLSSRDCLYESFPD